MSHCPASAWVPCAHAHAAVVVRGRVGEVERLAVAGGARPCRRAGRAPATPLEMSAEAMAPPDVARADDGDRGRRLVVGRGGGVMLWGSGNGLERPWIGPEVGGGSDVSLMGRSIRSCRDGEVITSGHGVILRQPICSSTTWLAAWRKVSAFSEQL